MNLKNYWIRIFAISIGIFFLNSANADVKTKASSQIFNFLNIIKEFASEKDKSKKEKNLMNF